MKQAGQIVLFQFPRVNLEKGKLRPALLLGRLPGEYDDLLLCMVSAQLRHCVVGFDEIIRRADSDFAKSGLKMSSVIRVGRLAVVEGTMIVGTIGQISPERLNSIRNSLTEWLVGKKVPGTEVPG